MSTSVIVVAGVAVLIVLVAVMSARAAKASAPVVAPASTPVNSCSLLSTADASNLAGAAVSPGKDLGGGMCIFSHSKDQGVVLAVQSLPGPEGAKVFANGVLQEGLRAHTSVETIQGLAELAFYIGTAHRSTLFFRIHDKDVTLAVANSTNSNLKSDLITAARAMLPRL